jgi:hypothetical protein
LEDNPHLSAENVFYLAPIVYNQGETFSGVVVRPGINSNGFDYSKADVAAIVGQLPGKPLVKDHNMSVDAVIGKFIGSEIKDDGSGVGKFTISATEAALVGKIKDRTLEYLSIGHGFERSTCTICNSAVEVKPDGKHQFACSHVLFRDYDGKTTGVHFDGIQVGHVALVQVPADYGCRVVQNSFMLQVKGLSDEIVRLRDLNAETASRLKAANEEVTKLRATRILEPPSKVITEEKPVGQGIKPQTWVEKTYGT